MVVTQSLEERGALDYPSQSGSMAPEHLEGRAKYIAGESPRAPGHPYIFTTPIPGHLRYGTRALVPALSRTSGWMPVRRNKNQCLFRPQCDPIFCSASEHKDLRTYVNR